MTPKEERKLLARDAKAVRYKRALEVIIRQISERLKEETPYGVLLIGRTLAKIAVEALAPVCDNCGQTEKESDMFPSDMFTCDECKVTFCQECSPFREDDDPVDLCTDCIKEDCKQQGPRVKRKGLYTFCPHCKAPLNSHTPVRCPDCNRPVMEPCDTINAPDQTDG